MAAAVRSAAASLCALANVATVVPLAVAQIPDAIAGSLPPRLAPGGPAAVTSLLRASGLALPEMAVAGALAALAVRWMRAGSVLLAGLVLLLAGLVGGYLAAGAVRLRALSRRHHGARGARRAGDGGRALDADRGGPRRSGRTGVGLHRKAPDRCQPQYGPEPGRGIAPGADPGKVAGGAPVPGTGATLDHG